jgi:hypothetical protein
MNQTAPTNLDRRAELIATVAWFSLFDYPLTATELQLYWPSQLSWSELQNIISNLPPTISTRQGFYFLTGQDQLISERRRRYNYSDRKAKKTLWFARLASLIPWVQNVAMANLMGAHNLRDNGDIDLLIITSPRRLWLTRLLLAGSLKILNLRPDSQHSRDTFCLSFLVSSDHLDLRQLRWQPDPYFRYWLAGLRPLVNRSQTYEQLISANNWLLDELPNWQISQLGNKRQITVHPRPDGWTITDQLETIVAKWQLQKLPPAIKDLLNQDSRVVANSHLIKMHTNDRRQEFYQQWQQLIQTLCEQD